MQRSDEVRVVLERLREFERNAEIMKMPASEKLGILNVSEALYVGLRSGNPAYMQGVKPELDRRLSYALPLMRRLAGACPTLSRIPTPYAQPEAATA